MTVYRIFVTLIMKKLIYLTFLLTYLMSYAQAQSVDFDKKLGEKNARMVEKEMGIFANQEMTAYVGKVGQKLVSNLEYPRFRYQFRLVPDPAPNAFALPGGYIYISTGIIALLESEDELACILGHEIIHSNDRHSVKQMRKNILPGLLEIPGNIVGVFNQSLGTLINTPIQTSNALIFASYSRKFETKADKYGITLAAKSGYNPAALADILTRMNIAIETVTGNKEERSYFADHPYGPKRTKKLLKDSEGLPVTPSENISNSLVREFNGVLFGESPAKGVLKDNIFLHPNLNIYFAFPNDWETTNQTKNVSGYKPDGKAAIILTVEKPGTSPQQAGQTFLENLTSETRNNASVTENYSINNNQGYHISLSETNGGEVVYADFSWIMLVGKTIRIVSVSTADNRDLVNKSANSLRSLTTDEYNSIKEYFIKVVEARENESLAKLSKRTGNILRLDLTAIINAHEPNDQLSKGELIKIVSEKKYEVK
jgi:predicted Zn-dependent protease